MSFQSQVIPEWRFHTLEKQLFSDKKLFSFLFKTITLLCIWFESTRIFVYISACLRYRQQHCAISNVSFDSSNLFKKSYTNLDKNSVQSGSVGFNICLYRVIIWHSLFFNFLNLKWLAFAWCLQHRAHYFLTFSFKNLFGSGFMDTINRGYRQSYFQHHRFEHWSHRL